MYPKVSKYELIQIQNISQIIKQFYLSWEVIVVTSYTF